MKTAEEHNEIFFKCGEPHFVWPHRFWKGNTSKCIDCRYFRMDFKSKAPYVWTGVCTSAVYRAELHAKGDIRTQDNSSCHWFFPTEAQAGEQEGLFNGET